MFIELWSRSLSKLTSPLRGSADFQRACITTSFPVFFSPYPPSLSHSHPFNFPFSFHYIQSNYLSHFILFQYRPVLFAFFGSLWRYSSLSSLFGSYLFSNYLNNFLFYITKWFLIRLIYIYIVFEESIYIGTELNIYIYIYIYIYIAYFTDS